MRVLFLILMMMFACQASAQDATETQTFAIDMSDPVAITVDLDARQKAIDCLASNMYYEARGESERGKVAVAMVTINRAKDERFPNDICMVVSQRSQFSWYKPGKIAQVRNANTTLWQDIRELAAQLYDKYFTSGHSDDVTHGATHFHSTRINPGWRGKHFIARIGNHVFFRIGR